MDIKLFFDPIYSSHLIEKKHKGSFRTVIDINQDGDVALMDKDIAFFSISDEYTTLREQLYALKRGDKHYRMVDLGTLRPGEDLQSTVERLSEVVAFLLDLGIVSVIIGATHAYTLGQYMGYSILNRGINVTNIDSKYDLEQEEEEVSDDNHLYKILAHQPGFLHKFTQIGYQQYLNIPEVVNLFEKLSFERHRLGEVRKNVELIEPVLRMSDMASFDLVAIRKADFTSKIDHNPFGFTAEEACQLAWYAGVSDQLTSMSFLGYKETEENQSDVMALSTMIWYFVEGYYHRVDDKNFQGSSYTKYAVMVSQGGVTLDFYKNTISGKWWMTDANDDIIACSYEDYELASKGELPNRWIKH